MNTEMRLIAGGQVIVRRGRGSWALSSWWWRKRWLNDGLMEDSFFSVILIMLQNAVHQHFVHKERGAQLAAGGLGLFNLGMSFSTTGNSRRNLCSLTEHVFLIKRFILHNPIEQDLQSALLRRISISNICRMSTRDYNSNNNYSFQTLTAYCVPSTVFNKQHFIYSGLGDGGNEHLRHKYYYYLHFADEDIEAWKGEMSCPRLQSCNWQKGNANPELSGSKDEFLCL